MAGIQIGDKVLHPKMPDWGLGKVLSVAADGKVKVYFVHAGEKTLNQKFVQLEKLEGVEAEHPILDNPTFNERAKGKAHKGLPDARLDFLKHFPQGFDDPEYVRMERVYKIDARELLLELLNESEFSSLLSAKNYAEIVKRALQVVNKTNLIFPNEKMGLKDGLRSPENMHIFAERLFALLYGPGNYRDRFEGFADCLEQIDASKWTTMTYFPFLAFPEEQMFLKPEITKHAAELTKAELNYRSNLNWLTYSSLLDFAKYLHQELETMEMNPRDMIDVQSFMWCITPGKYD
ncbi:DUF3553 domain-containing protein [Trichloromonas sp.]|uniref:DUF3553 domain-containing protein n=1 Tax=Trichloromonas sp. TaxID=3069249 RepID=UPI003D8165E5